MIFHSDCRRQIAGKAKRNQYYITEASPPPTKRRKKVKEKSAPKKAQLDNEANEEYPVILAKQKSDRVKDIKKKKSSGRQTYRIKENQKRRNSQKMRKENENPKTTRTEIAEVDYCLLELKELVKRAEMFKFWAPVRNKVTTENYHHTRKKSNDNVHFANDSEAVDSGVGSGSSGSLDGNNGDSSSGGGNVPSGGGGNIGGGGDKSNGQDDHGDDDDDDGNRKKRQLWESGEDMVNSSEEEKMETEECSSEEFHDCKEPVKFECEEPDGISAIGVQGSDQETGGAEVS